MKNEIPIEMTKIKKKSKSRREDKGDEKEHWSDNAQND